jgi:putative phosphoesterase
VRVAVVSDIHGNLTAFEAVLADLRDTAPDLVLHGGDLADSGSGPCEIVDRIRDLQWPGVCGNTDEMLFSPRPVMPQVDAMAEWTREQLGEARLAWLAALPRQHFEEQFALVHATPGNLWRIAVDDSEFAELNRPLAVYGHTHRPFVRESVANSGSVGLPYDGDARASYLLIDDSVPAIRRVKYDVEREVRRLLECGVPHAEWMVRMLRSAAPTSPPTGPPAG